MRAQPFLDMLDLDEEAVWGILDLATSIRAQPREHAAALQGKILYGAFELGSKRTQLSFSKAAALVGCGCVCERWDESVFQRGEALHDTRHIDAIADLLVLHLKDHEQLRRVAQASPVPAINAGCVKFDPMQALADAFSLLTYFGAIGGQRLLYVGMAGNVFSSVASLLTDLGVHVVALCPARHRGGIDPRVQAKLARTNRFDFLDELTPHSVAAEIRKADIVYVDTSVDGDRAEQAPLRDSESADGFCLTAAVYGASEAVIMSRTPIQSASGVEPSLFNHPNSIILAQAANRAYVQAAALVAAVRWSRDERIDYAK